MKHKIFKSVVVSLAALSLAACDMDVVPPAEISAASFWKTDKDAWYALNSCYANMPAMNIWDEMCTDNAHSHKPWEGNFEMVQQNAISTANGYGDYGFSDIRLANSFLTNVEKCDMNQEVKERMKAEARFFRAFSYLRLNQYFGKVPIVTELMPYNAENVERDPVEKVQQFILNELEDISKILPESYKGGYLSEKGRITKYGALALRARAALYFGNYAEAEKSAKEVINSNKYHLFVMTSALTSAQEQEAKEMDLYMDYDKYGIDRDAFIRGMFSYEVLWQGANANPTNPEFVVTREYMADKDNYDWTRYTYMIPTQLSIQDGYSSFEPMQDLIDAYWSADGKSFVNISVDQRKKNYDKIWKHVAEMSKEDYQQFASSLELMKYDYMKEFRNRDSRLYVTFLFPFKGWHSTPQGKFYYKWDPSVIGKNGNESWTGYSYRKMVSIDPYNKFGSSDDYPTIRYAEVLLTYAEAHLMNVGYDGEVKKALNEIRDRCGMPHVPEALGKKEAIDFLRNERRIELAVEGNRYNDVRRYGSEYCAKYLNGPSTAIDGSVVVDKHWDDRMMLMPIPTGAMDVNPLLKEDQNPGY